MPDDLGPLGQIKMAHALNEHPSLKRFGSL